MAGGDDPEDEEDEIEKSLPASQCLKAVMSGKKMPIEKRLNLVSGGTSKYAQMPLRIGEKK
jgi:hypothetical protein